MNDLHDDDHAATAADRLLAATIYLMTSHARTGCPRLACMVEHHLKLIARHPGSSERVAIICRQLAAAWIAIRRHNESELVAPATSAVH